jgi:hypothetical protein
MYIMIDRSEIIFKTTSRSSPTITTFRRAQISETVPVNSQLTSNPGYT